MTSLLILIKRNMKLFFKDKGMFFTSLITPAILLVLYATFLGNVYENSFVESLPGNFKLSSKLINGCVAGELISSLLAVSCVTVGFCSNFLMVQDKANKTINDLNISPIKQSHIAISYYVASFLSTFIICFIALVVSLIYVAFKGWYLNITDVLLLILDVFLLVLFGTAISSVINFFLSSTGQISAVGTIVSAGYGFICGAYMPISSFGSGLQKLLSFLPGTYATSLIRYHSMNGCFKEMIKEGIPDEVATMIKESLDCEIKFFDINVNNTMKFVILIGTICLLIITYILLNNIKRKK